MLVGADWCSQSHGIPGPHLQVCEVALGRVSCHTDVDTMRSSPPPGFDSCMGVAAASSPGSRFRDNEHVIYDQRQQVFLTWA